MNLHEYQSKKLFADFGLPVSYGIVATTVEDALAAVKKLGGDEWACKVQVHAGGRGNAGGVVMAHSTDEVVEFAERWLGNTIHTVQTGSAGQPVDSIYLEEIAQIERELYLGVVIDRSMSRVVVMASEEGGVEIEKVAVESPEKILRETIHPTLGALAYQGRELAFSLGLSDNQISKFTDVFMNLVKMFNSLDCSLVEINPLVITKSGHVHCLDAKINIDGNALYRQPDVAELRDPKQEDEREAAANEFDLNYVALDGNIGCMVNGAGLAMGTMDLVKLHGGAPANFLDVGGGVNIQSVSEAFKIILADPDVKTVLINIFGGIVSCATVAEGIVGAVKEVGVAVPVVVRFDGNSAHQGTEILSRSGLNIITAESLTDAAEKAVKATREPMN